MPVLPADHAGLDLAVAGEAAFSNTVFCSWLLPPYLRASFVLADFQRLPRRLRDRIANIRQHRKEFQRVAVRIVEKERDRASKQKRLDRRGLARRIEGHDVSLAMATRSVQQVVKIDA